MRLLFVAPGTGPIPPTGRGAIESVIWETARRARQAGHDVDIVNVRPSRLWAALPKFGRHDWIWVHHDKAVRPARAWARLTGARVVLTSHRPVDGVDAHGRRMLRLGAAAEHHLCLLEETMAAIREINPRARLAHAPNGTDVHAFRFAPVGNDSAILLGGISPRKRQREVLDVLTSDVRVVGPLDREDEDTQTVAGHPAYLGEWTRETLHQRLTESSALVLFSRAEAQPLVVGEAFAAGLSVVLSEAAARNVDRSLPWVRIVHEADELPDAVASAISENGRYRAEIRAHAETAWDWGPRVSASLATLAEWAR